MKRALKLISVLVLTILISVNINGRDPEKYIKIETSLGDIVVRLYNETPLHRDNMVKLANEGFYKDLLFHRVIKDFMIQGGDPQSRGANKGQQLGMGGPGYTIPAEFDSSLIHKKGAIAAARMGDNVNPEKRSSGSQFYIVQGRKFSKDELVMMEQRGMHKPFSEEEIKVYTTIGGTPHLDGGYTVFGEVVEGLDVLDLISIVPVDAYNRPIEDIVFNISVIDK